MLLLVQVVLLIAIGLHSSNADVKHVLDGSAQPPQHFHTNECQHPVPYPYVPGYPGSFPPDSNNAVPGSVAFWWADNNSPFKHAYEYFKKCSAKGNCVPPVAPGFQVPNPACSGCTAAQSGVVAVKNEYRQQQNSIDISKNPFLNGQIPVLPNSSCAEGKCNGGSNQIDISRNPFLNGNLPGSYKPPPVAPSCGGAACNNVASPTPGYNNNPFLNGDGCGSAGCKPISSISPQPSETPLDISKNPFLNGGFGKPTFSGNGQAIETGSNSFLGVQPSIPFGNTNIKTKPFPTNYPTPDDNPGPQPEVIDNQVTSNGKPFPTDHPSKSHTPGSQLCNGPDQTCVASKLCVNGVLLTDGSGLLDRRQSTEVCENDEVCCRLPSEATVATSSGFSSESSSASTSDSPNALPSRNAFPSILDIKAGQHPAPGSVFKFNGGAGISPGSIQVIADNESAPKPLVSSPGDSGSNNLQAATSDVPVFASTPDFSNDDLNNLSFISTTRGPQYLPPDASPKPPNIDISDLIPPSISTYQPIIPTTQKTVTKQVIPGVSIVSVHPQPTVKPFIPSSPQSFIPGQSILSYTPKPNPFEFLPREPSSPKPFIPQSPIGLIPYPSTPIAYQPFIPEQPIITPQVPFIKPVSEITHFYRPSTNAVSFENRFEPSQPTVTPYFPSETPGYKYPTPSPPFTYTSSSTSFNINDRYVPIKSKYTPKPYSPQPQPSSGYEYKTPIPSFSSPTPKPHSEGYEYKRPTPSFVTPFPSTNSNQYLPPFQTLEPNRIPGESIDSVSFVSKPTVRPPTNFPPYEGQPDVPISSIVQFPRPQQPSPPYAGCAAALKCVQEIYCTAEGVISPVPVILTNQQQQLRVPTTECRDHEAGIIGRCCRDPNYVDPWPSANSINGFDDGKYREDPRLGQYVPQRQRLQRSESKVNPVKAPIRPRSNPAVPAETLKNSTCGVRHFNSQPHGSGPIDVTFGEIPWQAMILRDSTRTLLCGGVIVKPNAVLTSAYCLDGMATSDILVKGGEWKLGIDEEPLPFQIVKVAAIIRHPSYTTGVLKNDLALLMLEENLRTAKNIAPICLSPTGQNKQRQCIVTGWGKRILQVHLRGAIMKSIDVSILDNNKCRDVISEKYKDSLPNYSENTICGYSRNDQCDVDYGSALACTDGNGQYTLTGIFSWDTGCKDEAQIGGYIPADAEWIEETCSKPLNQLKALDKKYNNN